MKHVSLLHHRLFNKTACISTRLVEPEGSSLFLLRWRKLSARFQGDRVNISKCDPVKDRQQSPLTLVQTLIITDLRQPSMVRLYVNANILIEFI